MKRLLPYLGCLSLLLLVGCADKAAEAQPTATPLASETPHLVIMAGTPEPIATDTPEPTAEPVDHIGQRARDNLLLSSRRSNWLDSKVQFCSIRKPANEARAQSWSTR